MHAKLIPATLAGLATLVLVPTLAFAQATETTVVHADGSSETTRTEDDAHHKPGVMLRYTVGLSYVRTGQSFDVPEKQRYFVHGVGVDMSLAAGVALSNSFAVHGTATFWRAFNPKAKGDFGSLETSTDFDGTQLTNFGIGGGFTFWTQSNMYFSLSVLASMLRVEIDEHRADTKWGIGGEVLIGKEWWIGNNFGLGAAVAGTIHFIPDKKLDDASGLLGFSVGPRLTMTFN